MNKHNKNFSRQSRRKPSRRNNTLQTAQAGYVNKTSSGFTRSPKMPKEFSVALLFRQQFNAESDRPVRNQYGLLEYLKNVPQYAPEFYQLYKYSRVLAVKYHFDIVNYGGRPLEIMGVTMPYDEAVSASVAQVAEKVGAIRKIVSITGGMDKASISTVQTAQECFGNPYFTKDYWVDENQSNNSTPLDPFEPVFNLIVTPILPGSQIAFVVTTRIEYHIQFFDLRVSRQLGAPSELEDMSEFEQPSQKRRREDEEDERPIQKLGYKQSAIRDSSQTATDISILKQKTGR